MNQTTRSIRPDIQPGDHYERDTAHGGRAVIDVKDRNRDHVEYVHNGEQLTKPAEELGTIINTGGYLLR